MSQTFKIRKGHDIKLVGGAPKTDLGRITASTYAVTPSDFPGITPKLVVKAGTQVKAGDTLFFDKDRPEVKICSPVSGEVAEVKRGAKRKILAVLKNTSPLRLVSSASWEMAKFLPSGNFSWGLNSWWTIAIKKDGFSW